MVIADTLAVSNASSHTQLTASRIEDSEVLHMTLSVTQIFAHNHHSGSTPSWQPPLLFIHSNGTRELSFLSGLQCSNRTYPPRKMFVIITQVCIIIGAQPQDGDDNVSCDDGDSTMCQPRSFSRTRCDQWCCYHTQHQVKKKKSKKLKKTKTHARESTSNDGSPVRHCGEATIKRALSSSGRTRQLFPVHHVRRP